MLISIDNYRRLQAAEDSAAIVPCKNGLSTILIHKDGKERYLHSKYDPVKEARTQVAQFAAQGEPSTSIIVFGVGMGYMLYELLNLLPPYGMMYVFEPEGSLYPLFFDHGGEGLLMDTRIQFFSYADDNELTHHLSNDVLTLQNCDAFSFFSSTAYMSVFPEEYNRIVETINTVSSNLLSHKTSIHALGTHWCTDYLRNYPYLFESASAKALFHRFSGKTAVIVAAGPSLTKNVRFLKNFRNQCLIIATDTALRVLENEGIRPHLVVSVSGNPAAYQKLRDTGYGRLPLLYKSQTAADVLANHNGSKFYARFNNVFLNRVLEEMGIDAGLIESGGSVACSSLDLAVKLGCTTVVFVGQDLALTGGEYHAKNATGYTSQSQVDLFGMETADIHGQPVLTLKNLYQYKLWIEEYISRTPRVRFIDATEGGARIDGTELLSLEEAIAACTCPPFDGDKQIQQCFAAGPLLNEFSAQQVRTAYQGAYADFQTAQRLLEDTLRQYQGGTPPHYEQINALLDSIIAKTTAIRYAILAQIWHIKSMRIGKDIAREEASLREIQQIMDKLDAHFKCVLEAK